MQDFILKSFDDKVNKNDNQSIKSDDETTFPQFSLNVSNPISWKLMLLIMIMQMEQYQ